MRALVAVLVTATLFAGCQSQRKDPLRPSDAAEPVFASPHGPVTVLALARDEGKKTIDAMISVGGRVRNLSIRRLEAISLPLGILAELRDPAGAQLVSFEIAWDSGEPYNVWFREATPLDALEVSMQRTGEGMREVYKANGQTFTVEYSTPLLELRQRRWSRTIGVGAEEGEARSIAGSGARVKAFEEYYARHVGSTLHENADGEVLASLINNEGFAELLVGRSSAVEGAGAGAEHCADGIEDKTAVRICAIASVCSVTKCLLGGWANFICVACGGTSLACGISEIGCWLADC